MAQNSLRTQSKTNFAVYMSDTRVREQINNILGGKDGQRFISGIVSAVTTNPALSECSNSSIVSAALLGESLKLSPSPAIGHYFLVPFNDRKNNRTVATFVLSWRGMMQLAIRSGQYKKINVLPIKEGELIKYDPLNEEIEVKLIEDEEAREKAPTQAYYAYFELNNGFRKAMLWTKARMIAHAEKYSMGFKARKGFTFWEKGEEGFDAMACKTMLRQLIGKYGIMSTEFMKAYDSDMAYIHDDGTPEYVDNEPITEPIVEAPVSEVVDPEPAPAPKGKKSAKAEMPTESAPEPTDEELAAFFAGAQIEG